MAKYDVKYNPSKTPITGATQIGNVAVATGEVDYSTGDWVAGIDDTTGYVIYSDTTSTNLAGRTTAGGKGIADPNKPTFWKTKTRSDSDFIFLINRLPGSPGTFSTVTDAKNWLNNSSNYGMMSSFTINTGEFNTYYTGGNVNAGSVNGFINNGGSNLIDDTYILNNPIGNVTTNAISVAQASGMNYNSYAYAWSVTWADNSTGIVRLGIDIGGQIVISPIDTADTRWLSGQTSNYSKSGTYDFPATFTPYYPLTQLGGHTNWC